MPAVSNVIGLDDAPAAMSDVSKTPVVEVAVCVMVSEFFQTTLVPTATWSGFAPYAAVPKNVAPAGIVMVTV